MNFDAVLFDLDGTLCRRTQDTEAMYERVFQRASEEPFGDPGDLWTALSGPPDHDDPIGYYGAGFARVAARYDRSDADVLALARELVSVIDDSDVALLPGAVEALDAAAAIGTVGVVTNGSTDSQRTKLDALGIGDRFDTVVCAAELPRSKPHTLPFERALAELDVTPDRTLYVGNTLEYDVAGAQNAGLAAAWLRGETPVGAYDPEYVLESLSDVPSILRRDDA
ncbi:HAD family hydrolase [Natronococcus sp. A-GB1]|uniref:HAD family hydrolase n=1 Tax=Natronococcus sp. A-GB1 TaxID=3037648 RepID=UPI00242013F1|nr:HAD family hydrolase [Natronococcus sp. A-GB1]MDG5760946.1 HAD family hydrolase [Natronococcus sp. A-GB1]